MSALEQVQAALADDTTTPPIAVQTAQHVGLSTRRIRAFAAWAADGYEGKAPRRRRPSSTGGAR